MNDFSQYRTDNLFLLIGSNPLPNYVAARLLAHEQTQIHFVYTTETESKIQPLENSLGRPTPSNRIKVDNADAKNIFSQVEQAAQNCKGSIGLHYTGGTKAMAVHAYRAIQAVQPEAISSYLDSKNLELLIDQSRQHSLRMPVGLEVKLTIEDLLKLHGFTVRKGKPIVIEPFQIDFCKAMLAVPQKDLRLWCDNNLRDEKGVKKEKDLIKSPITLPIEETAFRPVYPFWSDCKLLNNLADKWGRDIEFTAKFLDGNWLEHYTLWAIQVVSQESQIQNSGLSIWPEQSNRSFEFDVAAMRGYQLFAISCTTSANKGLIKSKLFEAYVRAHQMGGDEAKVAVVCRAPQNDPNCRPQKIQQELEETWDEAKGKIRVFGEEHLPRLAEHLKQWFIYSSGR